MKANNLQHHPGNWAWKKKQKKGWQAITRILKGPLSGNKFVVEFVGGSERVQPLPRDHINDDAHAQYIGLTPLERSGLEVKLRDARPREALRNKTKYNHTKRRYV